MILCAVEDVQEGMRTAAPVSHPRRPEMELLAADVPLDRQLLHKLARLGIIRIWGEHDATRDLDHLINAQPSEALNKAFHTLKKDFAAMSSLTVSAGSVQAYRQIIMELVCELVANRDVACLTEQLIGGKAELFTHAANVAYLAVLIGIDLETYIVLQRQRLGTEHARDITALGMGAMLHDIGKVGREGEDTPMHEPDTLDAQITDEQRGAYRDHVFAGYKMLSGTRAPASAMQVVLTHHQHWDGSGFPDMSAPTRNRIKGTQSGKDIHVFSRIVAAANLLENLLRDNGKKNPPAMALHALQDERFAGWLDPIVLDSVLRRVPPFPVGGEVKLNDGRSAVVIAPSIEQPCRPTVRLLDEKERLPDGRFPHMDLREHKETHIATFSGQPVEPYLFSLIEDAPLSVKLILGEKKSRRKKSRRRERGTDTQALNHFKGCKPRSSRRSFTIAIAAGSFWNSLTSCDGVTPSAAAALVWS